MKLDFMDPVQTPAFSWSLLYNARRAIQKRFPSIWSIPIRKKTQDVLIEIVKEGDHILDVGSCNRHLKTDLEKCYHHIVYKSMDVDRLNHHDYYSMTDIQETFDVVVMFECIEHLSLEEGLIMLREIHRILKKNGILILSTPNTFHPNRYWECTHKIPFRYDELGGFIETCHFQTENIYRIYNDSFFSRLFRLYVAAPIHRYFCIDFARSILLIGRRKED
ncbi:MAG: class I SAM-dependent methyltransferase [Candidatus Aureabacteria bacterium]|nr:class I SAM-dependent methyltransferase [Candidatus Auribacterota bacterium]